MNIRTKEAIILLVVCISCNIFNAYHSKPKEKIVYKEVEVYREIDIKQADSFTAVCTAYTAGEESTGKSPGDKGYGITASGKPVRSGVVAADINILPFGTKIYIEGMGIYEVWDKGGAVKGNKIDIYMETLDEAREFGRQERNIIILEKK